MLRCLREQRVTNMSCTASWKIWSSLQEKATFLISDHFFSQLIYGDYIQAWNLKYAYFCICLTISVLMVTCVVCCLPLLTVWTHIRIDVLVYSEQDPNHLKLWKGQIWKKSADDNKSKNKILRVQRVRIANHSISQAATKQRAASTSQNDARQTPVTVLHTSGWTMLNK